MCHVNKFYLHDGEARICNTRFLIDPFRIGNVALLFMNHTVTTIFAVGPKYYLFDSHSRDSRGLAVSDGLSVLLKFSSLQQLENYIKVIHLEYQGRESQYFQLQFLDIEIDSICRITAGASKFISRLKKNAKRKSESTVQNEAKIKKMKVFGPSSATLTASSTSSARYFHKTCNDDTEDQNDDIDFQKETSQKVLASLEKCSKINEQNSKRRLKYSIRA